MKLSSAPTAEVIGYLPPHNQLAYIAGMTVTQMLKRKRKRKMFNYRNEAHFSGAVVKHLRGKGYFVQRIETGSTGRGVPDIYCVSPDGVAIWLELKRVHMKVKGKDRAPVPWRPGQQAWLRNITRYKQVAKTLVAYDDCIVLVSHTHIWANDTILFSQCSLIPALRDL